MPNEIFESKCFDHAPNWPCPKCYYGKLILLEGSKDRLEHGWSEAAHGQDYWEPEWTDGVFSWVLKCSDNKCGHYVIASGKYSVDLGIEETPWNVEQVWKIYYQPYAFSEAPPIIEIRDYFPKELEEHLASAFSLFWIDPSSCLNKIRTCVEDILTLKQIPRFSNRNNRRIRLTLHSRIERYSQQYPETGKFLMALKWLGNEGSHSGKNSEIKRNDLIEAFEILEHAIEAIFSNKANALLRKANSINRRKGI